MVVETKIEIQAEAWNHILSFIKPTALVAIVELGIPDILEKHGGPMSLPELAAAIGCNHDVHERLHRLMRFLIFHGIFKKTVANDTVYYGPTPLSRFYTKDNLGAFVMLQGSPQTRLPAGLTGEVVRTGTPNYLKPMNGGEDSWSSPAYGYHRRIFSDAMAAHARVTTEAMINNCPTAFDGIGSLVDVGGRHGVALGMLVEVFPRIRGITFDLPEVVAKARSRYGVEFVGGNMFESVPKADALMLMWILHDWSDKACIEILKKCKEAIPADTGKVMIVDAIIDEDGEGDGFSGARLSLDMVMMAVVAKGKERSYAEWKFLLKEAGFSRHTVTNIKAIESLIEAYP